MALCAATSTDAKDMTMDLTPVWRFVADGVMGGVSTGRLTHEQVLGRSAARLTGAVSLENNGGFIQMAFDLTQTNAPFDATGWTGLEIDVTGNATTYDVRLRTDQLTRPWQSFRTQIMAPPLWTTLRLPFAQFDSHRTDATFAPDRLRRIGVLAVGREFDADISVAGLRLYR